MLCNNFVLHLQNNLAKSRSTSGPGQNISAPFLLFALCSSCAEWGLAKHDSEKVYFSKDVTLINTGMAEEYRRKSPCEPDCTSVWSKKP